ncbi:MAG: enoyl-CoA hydratase-related protein [Pseudomonadota bacterium]
MTSAIRFDATPPIGEIILNAPKKRNALSVAMWTAIPDLIEQANAASDVKVIIVHGGTAGAFAAGADIQEFETVYATAESTKEAAEGIERALTAIATSEKPVLAAIEGACMGAGVSIAMAADLRIAAKGSKFGVPPSKLGLVYPPADTKRLLDAVGPGITKDILFTARTLDADEAHQVGLVDRLVERGQAIDAARTIGADIAGLSQFSVRTMKQMIQKLLAGSAPEDRSAWQLHLDGFQGEDFQEGYRAFLEKRPPKFV